MARKLTTEEFIKKAKQVHGDKYDYSKVAYINSATKVSIICKEHGEFLQEANSHLKGRGCKKCGNKIVSNKLKGRVDSRKGTSKWTLPLLRKEASKYNRRVDFYKYSKGAYLSANKRNLLDEICKDMDIILTKYTDESVAKVALKCTTRTQFMYSCKGAYNYATRRGILAKVCSHMEVKLRYYSDEEIFNTAINYSTRTSFKKHNQAMYAQALNRNLLDASCRHMPTVAAGGFDKSKPGILYYLRIEGGTAYKIGITNYSVKERYRLDELDTIVTLKEWYYADGAEARRQEQKILKEYAYAKYTGSPLLYDGNTELFDRDILLLDT